DAAIAVKDGAVADHDVLHQPADALSELDGGGGGRESAIGDGDVFRGIVGAPFRNTANNSDAVIASGNGAVGNGDIVAAHNVDAICPDRFLQAGVNVHAIDDHARAGKQCERPAGGV